jgi:hypothetical protein
MIKTASTSETSVYFSVSRTSAFLFQHFGQIGLPTSQNQLTRKRSNHIIIELQETTPTNGYELKTEMWFHVDKTIWFLCTMPTTGQFLVMYFLPVPLEIFLRPTGSTVITPWKTLVYFL